MSDGLIDQLSRGWSDELGWCCDLDDLRDLLRSDKTREALADAVDSALGAAILGRQAPKPLVIDAVVRVLTGDGGNSREGC